MVGISAAGEETTERKRAEEALRESEERFRTMADNIAQFAWMADASGWIFWYNRRWYEYTGTTFEQMQGWGWQSVHHPDHVDRVVTRIRRSFETGDVWEDTFPLRGKDGEYRWFLSRAMPIRDADGRIVRWFGTNTDITERLEFEERLRGALAQADEGRRLLDALLEHIPLGITIADSPGVSIRRVSRYGEQLVGGPDCEWYHADGMTAAKPDEVPLARAAQTGELVREEEWMIAGGDGARVPVLCTAAPIFDAAGNITGAVAGWQDIQQRKEAEQALRDSVRREQARAAELQAIMEAVPVATFVARDPECREMVGSRRSYELLRLDGSSNLSKSAPEGEAPRTFRAVKDGREIPANELPVQRAAATGQTVRNYEFDCVFEDGSRRTLLGNAAPFTLDNENATRGAVGAFVDITELKHFQESLRRSNEDLERFAYAASHDLQEPLRAITGFSELLVRKHAGDGEAAEYVGYIRDAAKRMTALIQDLLDYSRIAHERVAPQGPISLEAALQEALWNLQTSVRETGAKITSDPLPEMAASHRLMVRLFQNLIGNALKYRSERTPEIHISSEDAGEARVFSVRDNGIGIDMRYADAIFRVFQRLHSREQYAGTGIGLAVCKRIVQQHGGRIWVESLIGEGSTFYFSIAKDLAADSASSR